MKRNADVKRRETDRKNIRRFILFVLLFVILPLFVIGINIVLAEYKSASAMPFYDLRPENLVVRSEFYTSYPNSGEERKHNIKLASESLDNTFVDVGGEFSFNKTVGERTVQRGYKISKIIINGEFVDGVGGGVCQVSTTLYNAVLLSGLEITEYHSHSLPVSYIAPSFDAMVNSGWADFRFVNNTYNPIIIKSYADDNTIRIEIIGEPMKERLVRKSIVTEEIKAPSERIVIDENNEYPELREGEKKIIRYSKNGFKSEGYLMKMKDNKIVDIKKIRSDKYQPRQGIVIYGKTVRTDEST